MKLRTQLLLGYAVVFVLMGLIATISYQGARTIGQTQRWVERSQGIVSLAYEVQTGALGMQSAKRGYLITGSAEDLERFEVRQNDYLAVVARLRASVADDPGQTARVAEIEGMVGRWLDSAAGEIGARGGEGAGASRLVEVAVRFGEDALNRSVFKRIDEAMHALVDAERAALAERSAAAADSISTGTRMVLVGTVIAIALGIGVMLVITRRVLTQVGGEPGEIAAVTAQIAQGNLDVRVEGASGIAASLGELGTTMKSVARQANVIASGDYSVEILPRSEKDELGLALQTMNRALRRAAAETADRDWLKTGLTRLNETLQGDPEAETLAARVIAELAGWLDAKVGAFYLADAQGAFSLLGSYAYVVRKNLSNRFGPGEGLVGQAALEKQPILLRNVPEDYVRVTSGLGEHVPRFIAVLPFAHEGRVKGVVELGTLNELTAVQLDYLQQAMPAIAVAVESAHSRDRLAQALAQSQQLTEELQAQQEELRVANEELEEQTGRLKQSEERLKIQQEELEVSNEELEEKNELLERQKQQVEHARRDLSVKAEELALASKYKSEFLANMSHELRTPLNSLLLLAQSLAQNKEGNLSADQVEAARVIHGSGRDLLDLINEILDLSKIEAGRMDLDLGSVPLEEIAAGLRGAFAHMAAAKGLAFEVSVDGALPAEIVTDRRRLDQILRNLVSNAVKFTERGEVRVALAAAQDADQPDTLAVTVTDSGIGIPQDKQRLIFEAFQQADGTTTRRFGGTGLGLTISRELAGLLGGRILVDSREGEGSTFTLYVPMRAGEPADLRYAETPPVRAGQGRQPEARRREPAVTTAPFVADDRESVGADDWTILVIEDDPRFASILVNTCHDKGLKCIAAPSGEAGLDLVARYQPKGVILDMRLPGIDGMSVLAGLKEDIRTRHIPVHVVSVDDHRTESLRKGAIGHAVKPLGQKELEGVFDRLSEVSSERAKRVLVIEDDPVIRRDTVALIGNDDVEVDEVVSGEAALESLRSAAYDCVVLDLKLPDMSGKEILERLEREKVALPPVIVHTARELSPDEEHELREHADSIVVKDVRSPERLLDEVSLFLHRVVSQMPEPQRKIIHDLYDSDAVLRGKTVLIVDDDMRTTFALARLLEEHDIRPLKAENGERALELLEQHADVDIVLMDVMMPVMDGYETMQRIRARERFGKLPIIALTAKAMQEDRAKCLQSGASDYLPKPVDTARLLSMMRVWLHA